MTIPTPIMLLIAGCIFAFAILVLYGRHLERHPEKSAVGRAVADKFSDGSRESIEQQIQQVYATAYDDGVGAMREAYRVTLAKRDCLTCPQDELPDLEGLAESDIIDLDELQPERDPSERWADIDNK